MRRPPPPMPRMSGGYCELREDVSLVAKAGSVRRYEVLANGKLKLSIVTSAIVEPSAVRELAR